MSSSTSFYLCLNRNFYQKLTKINKKHQTLSIWWCPVFLLPWIILFAIVLVVYDVLPTPILQNDEVEQVKRKIQKYEIY